MTKNITEKIEQIIIICHIEADKKPKHLRGIKI